MCKIWFLIVVICSNFFCLGQTILHHAHAHNDYLKKNPLNGALSLGISSIEVDIFSKDNELLVAHTRLGVVRRRKLQALYLDPLKQIIEGNNGLIFPNDSTRLILMIDIKNDPIHSYELLLKTLQQYEDLLFDYQRNSGGPIEILLSGKVPRSYIQRNPSPLIAVDGRISDLEDFPNELNVTRISFNYKQQFDYRGRGEVKVEDLKKIQLLVEKSEQLNVELRPWGVPNKHHVWRFLMESNVSRISIDNYSKFLRFYTENTIPTQ